MRMCRERNRGADTSDQRSVSLYHVNREVLLIHISNLDVKVMDSGNCAIFSGLDVFVKVLFPITPFILHVVRYLGETMMSST